ISSCLNQALFKLERLFPATGALLAAAASVVGSVTCVLLPPFACGDDILGSAHLAATPGHDTVGVRRASDPVRSDALSVAHSWARFARGATWRRQTYFRGVAGKTSRTVGIRVATRICVGRT